MVLSVMVAPEISASEKSAKLRSARSNETPDRNAPRISAGFKFTPVPAAPDRSEG